MVFNYFFIVHSERFFLTSNIKKIMSLKSRFMSQVVAFTGNYKNPSIGIFVVFR
jgi:hypothetical protein